MARQHDGADDHISTATLPTTVIDNFTIAGWFYYDSLATDNDVALFNGDTAVNGWGLYYNQADAGLRAIYGGVNLFGGGSLAATAWTHILLRRSGGTGQVFADGAPLGSSFTGMAPNAPSGGAFAVGDLDGRSDQNLSKRTAEIVVTDRALSDDEIAMLGKGFSPLFLNPRPLLYWPMLGRYSPEIDVIGGNNGTLTGATAGRHPRVIYPSPPHLAFFGDAAAGWGSLLGGARNRLMQVTQ